MSTDCKICGQGIDSFTQTIKFLLTEDGLIQEAETLSLACGCTIDFPDWQLDMKSGMVRINNFVGEMCLDYYDEEIIFEEDE